MAKVQWCFKDGNVGLQRGKIFLPNQTIILFNYFSSDPKDEYQYVFIENFCPKETDTSILEVHQNGSGQMFQFDLASFMFTDEPDAEIFMHCDVSLVLTS